MCFKQSFEDREDAIKAILEAGKLNFKAFKDSLETHTIKQKHAFLNAVGGSGAGKTRAASEVINILRKHNSDIFGKMQEIYVDFSNGNGHYTGESLIPSNYLGVRIFAAVLRQGAGKVERMVKQIGSEIFCHYSNKGVFDTEIVLQVVSTKFRELLNIDKAIPLPIVIILDEFQKTIGEVPEWKKLYYTIGDYMCSTQSKNECSLRDKLVIVPVIAGTLLYKDVTFEPTDYTNKKIPLPSFSPKIVMKILKAENIDNRLLEDRELLRLWYLMGLVPRNLEDAYRIATEKLKKQKYSNIQPGEDLFCNLVRSIVIKTEKTIEERYKFDANICQYTDKYDQQLAFYAVTATSSPYDKWVRNITLEGKLFKTIKRRIFLPHFIFKELTTKYYKEIAKVMPTFASDFTWQHLEELDLKTLSARINGLIDITGKNIVGLDDIFPGVWKDEHLNPKIQISSVKYEQATQWFIPIPKKGNKGKYSMIGPSEDIPIDSNKNAIIKSADRKNFIFRSKAGNVSMDGLYTAVQDNSDALFIIQHKYKEEPSITESQITNEMPVPWYNHIVTSVKEAYPHAICYFVYITNAKLGTLTKIKAIEKCDNLLIIDQSSLEEYISPNILPYYRIMELK